MPALPPNSCNWNWYDGGAAKLGLHADDEWLFDGDNQPISILGFSIGGERRFDFAFGDEKSPQKYKDRHPDKLMLRYLPNQLTTFPAFNPSRLRIFD